MGHPASVMTGKDRESRGTIVLDEVHIGAIWRIRMDRCARVLRRELSLLAYYCKM